jgi:RHS repeat-associated protein
MPFNNSTGAMWLTITNVAVLNDGTNPDIVTNVVGNLLLAKNSETFTHDWDGNLTGDSLWTNVWNGENRRVTIESRSTLLAAARRKESWTILADGRWVERIVSTNNGTDYYPAQTNRYVWNQQVLLAVLDHTNGVVVSFMRGLDLSGSLQGAGGVGGVLVVKAGASAQCGAMASTTHFTCYDGNGNVTALLDAAAGEASARYEYAPFAEKLRETGPMAKLNPIRYSTQYADDVTGDTKYLFRDYHADTGRWLSRDPIEESGGRNVYAFVQNTPSNKRDFLGLYQVIVSTPTKSSPFEGWFASGSIWLNYHYATGRKIRSPDGSLTGNFVDTIHNRAAYWTGCACGTRLAGYYKKTVADIYVEHPENELWLTASGVSIFDHETSHASNQLLYDQVDDFAHSVVYNKCISQNCRKSWEKWHYAMTRMGIKMVKVADLGLEVRDYPEGHLKDLFTSELANARIELFNTLQAVLETGLKMALICSL